MSFNEQSLQACLAWSLPNRTSIQPSHIRAVTDCENTIESLDFDSMSVSPIPWTYTEDNLLLEHGRDDLAYNTEPCSSTNQSWNNSPEEIQLSESDFLSTSSRSDHEPVFWDLRRTLLQRNTDRAYQSFGSGMLDQQFFCPLININIKPGETYFIEGEYPMTTELTQSWTPKPSSGPYDVYPWDTSSDLMHMSFPGLIPKDYSVQDLQYFLHESEPTATRGSTDRQDSTSGIFTPDLPGKDDTTTMEPESWTCPIGDCNKSFQQRHKYNKHIRSHSRHYSCPYLGCEYGAYLKKDIRRHFDSVHGKAKIPCPVKGCEYSLDGPKGGISRRDGLRRHLKSHGIVDEDLMQI